MLDLILQGILIHLVVDFFFQNDWMAVNKSKRNTRWFGERYGMSYPHPAGVAHAALHGIAMLLIFPWYAALSVAIAHYLIDLRSGLAWWRTKMRQTTDPSNPAALHVAIWQDQIAHVLVIAATVKLMHVLP